eukprot:gene5919-6519_t
MNPIPIESFYNQYGIVEGGKYRKKISSSYNRQIDAYYAYDSLPPRDRAQTKVFSYETSSTGKRQFLLSDITTFYEEFSNVDSSHRHVYELIRDSFPCRLYFDLEFNQPANPLVQGQELTMKWIDLVLWKIYQYYNISVGRGDVIVLDSCTEEKFSKHLHLLLFNHEERNHHCKGEEEEEVKQQNIDGNHSITRPHQEYLFENNIEVGHFVQSILWDITKPITTTTTSTDDTADATADAGGTERENDLAVVLLDGQYRLPKEEYQCFWVNPSKEVEEESENLVKGENHDPHPHPRPPSRRDQRKVCFVDLGVYTRNRAFRLFNCCKYGKTTRLSINPKDVKHFAMLREVRKNHRYPIRRVLAWTFIVPADLFIADSSDGKTSLINVQASESMGPAGNGNDRVVAGDERDAPPATFASFASFFNHDRYSFLPILPKDKTNGMHSLSRTANFVHNMLHRQQYDGDRNNNGSGQRTWKDREVARSHYPRQSSLFPKLDAFIQHTFAERGGVVGYISSWSLFYRSHGSFPFYVLRYQIGKNRYCEHVQRPHKSNGVYFDVNLMAGEVQQGCWDMDCRGFNYATFDLPREIWSYNVEEVKSAIQNIYHHSISS